LQPVSFKSGPIIIRKYSCIDFHIKRKPVVESQRIFPVALGVSLVLGVLILWRIRKRA